MVFWCSSELRIQRDKKKENESDFLVVKTVNEKKGKYFQDKNSRARTEHVIVIHRILTSLLWINQSERVTLITTTKK